MSWHLGRLAAFDTETTGVDVEGEARIVSAAVILVGADKPTDTYTWLINPGIDIPAEASAIHGITTERAVAEGRDAAEAIEEIAAAVAGQLTAGIPIVAMNARFDLTLLDRECRRHGLPTVVDRVPDDVLWPVIDPLIIDKQVDKYRKGKRTLTALCEHYEVVLEDAHTAEADALATVRLAYKLAVRQPKLRVPVERLHHWQESWAREQAASFQEHCRRTDPDVLIEGAWPMVPYTGGAL